MSILMLKSDGSIDVTRLGKDLRNALDFDMKYKQTDNMKKRACKISADYDEFKAFVACAHLKTVRYYQLLSTSLYVSLTLIYSSRLTFFTCNKREVAQKFLALVQRRKVGTNQLLLTILAMLSFLPMS